jgi:hypothetical protein
VHNTIQINHLKNAWLRALFLSIACALAACAHARGERRPGRALDIAELTLERGLQRDGRPAVLLEVIRPRARLTNALLRPYILPRKDERVEVKLFERAQDVGVNGWWARVEYDPGRREWRYWEQDEADVLLRHDLAKTFGIVQGA